MSNEINLVPNTEKADEMADTNINLELARLKKGEISKLKLKDEKEIVLPKEKKERQ